jgi:thiol-disulfide isomerase/thioredoxin
MKTITVLLLSFFLLCKLCAQDVGSKAPPLLFSKSLNYPATLTTFKNKYVVLDFWATWCAPCIASFPHLNDLSKKFASDSVAFAIISSEEQGKVAAFLKNRNIQAIHLIDSITTQSKKNAKGNDLYGLTAQAFQVRAIPHCVVIDKRGTIRWIGSSAQLQEEDLHNILNGKATAAERKQQEEREAYRKERERQQNIFQQLRKDTIQGADFFAVTTKVPYQNGGMSAGEIPERKVRFAQFPGHSFAFFYMYFKRVPFNRIQNRLPKTDSSIFFRLEMGSTTGNKTFRATALQILENTYNIKFKEKKIVTAAWELSISDRDKFFTSTQPLDSLSDYSSSDYHGQEMVYSNFTLQEVAKDLENELKVFIIADKDPAFTKLCDITIPKGDLQTMRSYLLNTHGIAMKKVTQAIEVVEIIPAPSVTPGRLTL